jgi:hypothetical protein
MNRPVLVRDGDHLEISAGQTAYVWAGGMVVAHGGRVTVGAGGVCLSDGDTAVNLVRDGVRVMLPEIPAPVAVMRQGRVNAETGSLYVGPGCRYTASGATHVSRVSGASGEVTEGRLVELARISNEILDEVWSETYEQWISPASPQYQQRPRSEMAAEPGPDAAAWLAPLVQGLLRHGATPLATQTRRSRTALRVSTPDPMASAKALYADLAVPPTVMLHAYYTAPPPFVVALETNHDAYVELVASVPIPIPRPLPGLMEWS